MPPPTAADSWLTARRFGIVIDAGSSGSRLQIYSWRDPRVARDEGGQKVAYNLPKVEKGTQDADEWVSKVEPGLSSFAENPDGVASYLRPLLEHARSHIPPSLHSETPLFLLATAGMRLLSPEHQASVLQSTCQFLKFHSEFRIDDPSVVGPCGSSVRIITGEEEGLFGWIAVNYLMDGFGRSDDDRTTYGFLDMGGASTQIAFEPSPEEREKAGNLIDVRLRLLGGEEIRHSVFVTTWLGYGTNQARERYVAQAIDAYEMTRPTPSHGEPSDVELIEDPCLPKDLTLTEQPIHVGPSTSHTRKPHTLVGTGSFSQCLSEVTPLLNKTVPCPDSPCLFNGVHVPPIDFSVSHFIGVSEYWYSSEHIFGLGGAYDFVQYERAAQEYCGKPWSEVLRMHEESKEKGHLGGDGEVQEKGEVVGLDKWGDKVEISRLEMQCFKAAWIVNVLHDGLGMPRIVDPGGNHSTHGDDLKKQAEQKGLGRPTFQSMDTVGDIAISWTLGKMVLEASREVPP
ncbi:nucleoside phosphatase GDA1/CD39, partial [Stereum hirsutum FP-91666 SS1]|uniref:nucleoside phosphatase GDA1/CD39 n=1 Tax=Stereum hirsutum (strain FP-91666) TaxID=721885 RepID=UPI000440A382